MIKSACAISACLLALNCTTLHAQTHRTSPDTVEFLDRPTQTNSRSNPCNVADLRRDPTPVSGPLPLRLDLSVIPKFVLQIPIGTLSFLGWSFMSAEKRTQKVSEKLYEKAKNDEQIKGLLPDREIKRLSDEVASYFAQFDKVPKELDVAKFATDKFISAVIEARLRGMKLPCKNDSDYKALSYHAMASINHCLSQARNNNDYEKCISDIEQTATYHVGKAVLQVTLKDTLASSYPNTTQGHKELQGVIQVAVKDFDNCAKKRVLRPNVKDQEIQTQVCVGESFLRTVKNLGTAKIDEQLKPLVKDAGARLRLRNEIFDRLKNPPCAFAEHLKTTGAYTERQYGDLATVFSQPDSTEIIKAKILSCADSLSEIAGESVLGIRLKSEEALIKLHAGNDGKLSPEEQKQFDNFVSGVVTNSYKPCIKNLIATKASRKENIIDPLQCEENILGHVGSKALSDLLPVELDKLLKDFSADGAEPALQTKAQTHKENALTAYTQCSSGSNPTQTQLINCVRTTVEEFAQNFASLSLEKTVGAEFLTKHDDINKRTRSLVAKCVSERLEKAADLSQLSRAVEGIGPQCNGLVMREMVPVVADASVRDTYVAQGLDASDFLSRKLPKIKASLEADLDAAKDVEQINQAIHKFQNHLSWETLKDLGEAKTESYFSTSHADITPEEKDQNRLLRNEVRASILNTDTQQAIQNAITDQDREAALKDATDRLTVKLGGEKLGRELKLRIQDKSTREKLYLELITSLKSCLASSHNSDPTKNDCAVEFEKLATWSTYQAAARESVSLALSEMSKKDPSSAQRIIESIERDYHNPQIRARIEATVGHPAELIRVTNGLTADIAGTVAKAAFRHGVDEILPPAHFNRDSVATISAAEAAFDNCLKTLDRADPEFAKKMELCLGQFIQTGASSASRILLDDSMKRFIPADLNIGTVEIRNQLNKRLSDCFAKIKISPSAPGYADRVTACATLATSHAAIDVGVLRESKNPGRRQRVPTPEPVTELDELVSGSANGCYTQFLDGCKSQVAAIHAQLDSLSLKENFSADDVKNSVLQSKYFDYMLEGELAQRLEKDLTAQLSKFKDPTDSLNYMQQNIDKASGHTLLGPLLASPPGQKFIADIKARKKADPNLKVGEDPRITAAFKDLLLHYTNEGSFADMMLMAVAGAKYESEITSHWNVTLWVTGHSMSAKSYRSVMKTTKGQDARSYFARNILTPLLNGQEISAAKMKTLQNEIGKLLKAAAKQVP